MKVIDVTQLREDIHFPINRAVYKKPPKRNWFQKLYRFFTYKRNFELMEDYVLWIPKLKKFLFTPAPFLYDNASVPKLLSSLYNSDGMLLLGALPHDFGYRYKCLIFVNEDTGKLHLESCDKYQLDALLRYLCTYESGFKKASYVAWAGVKFFGFFGWNSNRKKNCNLYEDYPNLFNGGKL